MKRTHCLYGGPVFDGEHLFPRGTVVFDQDGIQQILPEERPEAAANRIDVRGQLISPGLVDLHSDALEKCIEMRPGIFFDPEFALQNLDLRVATCGITTFCHAVSFSDNELGLRSCHEAERLVRLIREFARSGKATVRHLVHLRCEVSSKRTLDVAQRMVTERMIDLISFMDHTPGQGQFKTLQSYVDYYSRTYKVSRQEASSMAERKMELREEGWRNLVDLTQSIRNAALPVLSHDDDSAEKILFVSRLGVTAAEFPVSLEAVRAAREHGMKVFMGAPNLIRGCSSNGHLKAREAISGELCDGLLSDYYPECLIQSPFTAHRNLSVPLEKCLRLVTSSPGDYLSRRGIFGRLLPGGPADIIVASHTDRWAGVTQTWVGGRCVLRSDS